MNILRALAAVLFSRAMLGCLLVVCLGCAIWFGGPYVGIGAWRPLEGSGERIIMLVLSLSFVLFWLLHWPVSVVGAAALCLLIWYGAPLLVINDTQPFAPEWLRMLLVGSIVILFGVYIGSRIWAACKANNALLRKLMNPTGESPAHEQLQEVHHILRGALQHMRSLTTGVSRFKRVFQHSRFIYELPWYMVFGAPGTGKTTLLLNSGLKFPLADQLGSVSLAGVSGTRNCVWWFTNEAVLIDTAGRYTTHEVNQTVDAAEWKGFLGLLRKYRPRAPLNGAMVAISVEDLVSRSPAALNQLAAHLRDRLAELQNELGISFPVYLLVTKMDLIRGFDSYFGQLNAEARRQPFGFTLPWEQGRHRQTLAEIREGCAGECSLLQTRLEQGLNIRLHEEYDPERRRALYCLPGEFAELRAPLMQLIDNIFFESRYGATDIHHILRGVYFTSAIQENDALVIARTSLARRVSALIHSGARTLQQSLRAMTRQVTDSRSYFLEDVLRRVIFPESFLVRRNTRWELRFLLARGLGHIVVILMSVGLASALLTSQANNTELLDTLRQRGASLKEQIALAPAGSGQHDGAIAHVLEQACSLTTFTDLDMTSPPFSYRVGLYTGSEPLAATEALCITLRERFLLPRFNALLEANLEQAVQVTGKATGKAGDKTASKASTQQEPDRARAVSAFSGTTFPGAAFSGTAGRAKTLYDALLLYQTFYDPEHFAAAPLLDWLTTTMTTKRADLPDTPRRAAGALPPNLFAPNLFASDPLLVTALEQALTRTPAFTRPLPPRQDLIDQARRTLQAMSREQRLYMRVLDAMQHEAPKAFIPSQYTGEDSVLVRADGGALTGSIAGLFTYDGHHEVFIPGLGRLLPEAVDTDAWLLRGNLEAGLGTSSSKSGPPPRSMTEMSRLERSIRKLYYQDYVRAWSGLLESVHAGNGMTPEQDLALLTRLSSSDSPLDSLARAVIRETTLTAKDPSAVDQLAAAAEKKLRARTKTTNFMLGGADEAATVDSRFEALRKVVLGTTDPAAVRAATPPVRSSEMEEIRLLLTEFALYTRDLHKAAVNRTMPPASDIVERLRTKAMQLPPFFGAVLHDLADRGATREGISRGTTLSTLVQDIADPCRSLLSRFPFTPQGRDADPAAFNRVLAPGGLIDAYFTKHLTPLADMSASPWIYVKEVPGAPDLAPFETASSLRNALYGQNPHWEVTASVTVVDMDPRIERLDLSIGDKVLRYEHGPNETLDIVWDSRSPKMTAGMAVWPRTLGLRPIQESGVWALFRLLGRGEVTNRISPEQFWITFDLNGYALTLEIVSPGPSPLGGELFDTFTCPQALP